MADELVFSVVTELKSNPRRHMARQPSFDGRPDAVDAFNVQLHSDLEPLPRKHPRRKSNPSLGDVHKKQMKSSKLSMGEKLALKAHKERKSAAVELTVESNISEDHHIMDAWGTVSPRGTVTSRRGTVIPEWNITDEPEAHESQYSGLKWDDQLETRATAIQHDRRRSSVPEMFLSYSAEHTVQDDANEAVGNLSDSIPEVIKRLTHEASLGWKESQFSLGYYYDTGAAGCTPDFNNAVHYYSEAANQGHVTAMNNLGVILATGHRGKVKANPAEALHWYKKAGENGHPNAEFHVGLAFLKGQGAIVDETLAFSWFMRAAKQGHILAMTNVGAMYMSGQGVDKDYKQALKWSKKGAHENSCIAAHNLAVMYAKGMGVTASEPKSLQYLQQAKGKDGHSPVPAKLSAKTLRKGHALLNM